jgi:hypothetical protein
MKRTPLAAVTSVNFPGTIGLATSGGETATGTAGATCADELQPFNMRRRPSALNAEHRRERVLKLVIEDSQLLAMVFRGRSIYK